MRVPRAGDDSGLLRRIDPMMPMIDVVFLLLIFFLWSSSFERPERETFAPPVMPAAVAGTDDSGTPEPVDFDEVVIVVSDDGDGPRYRLNDRGGLTLADVLARVRTIASLGVNVPVIVDPDGGVSIEDVVAVHDGVRDTGIAEVLLAVEDMAAGGEP